MEISSYVGISVCYLYLINNLFCVYFSQEQLECSKRGWELQNLRKLKDKEEEQQMMEGEEDLFTYTREDAYNMVCVISGNQTKSGAWILLHCCLHSSFLCNSTGVYI